MQQAAPPTGGRTGKVLARVEARLIDARESDGVLTVDLSRHDAQSEPDPDAPLFNNFLVAFEPGPHGDPWQWDVFRHGALTSVAVVSRARAEETPDRVVGRLFGTLPGLSMSVTAALVDAHTCRVGLRPRMQWFDLNDDGMLLTMTCQDSDAPVELFPALLYSWLSWWYRRATQLRGREIGNREVPRPPGRLDLVVRGHCFHIQVGDFTPTTWRESSSGAFGGIG